ncbi:hypothetical protein CkaCkLH20_02035 [Colletotrichum karsti]|uniref:Uncharacterized protein n=1 Tax=Colletotrichum karsti TaxID=1095194 RepID=A0A9P6LP77_9PEZI|nr:uncharacterized protein CkaCkLH20_02035 [Colletotrichum karsti]KAF9880081.1 hypothetical protein CkaCkLH20_02035 [Colletotrichum karsti]
MIRSSHVAKWRNPTGSAGLAKRTGSPQATIDNDDIASEIMVPNILPDWARVALTAVTVVSYLPQYHRILEQGDSEGLSLYYVLFNLISATEQLTVGFFLNVNNTGSPREDVFVNNPATAGDWFNLAQLAIVWICSLVLLILCFRYSATDGRRLTRDITSATYIFVLSISLVPVVFDAANPDPRSEPRRWAQEIFLFAHYLFFLPLSSILILAAVIPQIRMTRKRGSPGALSLPGLAGQAVVFAILAISWMIRVKYPPYLPSWDEWYRLTGWPVVNNGFFALGQLLLLWIATRGYGGDADSIASAETQPLLSDG